MLKSVFENEIIRGMEISLVKQANSQNTDNLEQAVEHLNSAITIFEDTGLTAQADAILNILIKIAKKGNHKKPKHHKLVSDRHTDGLTSEKALKNLEQHGTMFNMADVAFSDDLDLEIGAEAALFEEEGVSSKDGPLGRSFIFKGQPEFPHDWKKCDKCGYDHNYEQEEASAAGCITDKHDYPGFIQYDESDESDESDEQPKQPDEPYYYEPDEQPVSPYNLYNRYEDYDKFNMLRYPAKKNRHR